jgi:thiol-disulfide isomerase/thioredoxin
MSKTPYDARGRAWVFYGSSREGTVVRKLVFGLISLAAILAVTGFALYQTNGAPAVRPLSTADVMSVKPFVIKMHAKWCPKCMMQKGVWSDVEQAYAGRVHLLVMDFTDDDTTRATEQEARRLGLGSFFDEYAGATGFVVVLNPRREVTAEVGGRDFETYRAAIDAALVERVLVSPPTPGE